MPGATCSLITATCKVMPSALAWVSTRPAPMWRCAPAAPNELTSHRVGRARRSAGCPVRSRCRPACPASQRGFRPGVRPRWKGLRKAAFLLQQRGTRSGTLAPRPRGGAGGSTCASAKPNAAIYPCCIRPTKHVGSARHRARSGHVGPCRTRPAISTCWTYANRRAPPPRPSVGSAMSPALQRCAPLRRITDRDLPSRGA